jgi:hypothetical protein
VIERSLDLDSHPAVHTATTFAAPYRLTDVLILPLVALNGSCPRPETGKGVLLQQNTPHKSSRERTSTAGFLQLELKRDLWKVS